MSTLPILEIPHPTLRQRAKKVRRIDSKTLRLSYDMVDTLREAGGVGLAANQVGQLQRIIVVQLPEEESARIYVNPEIVKKYGARQVEEGCLSLPGYKGLIERSVWIKFAGMDHCSKNIKFRADDLLAQILEHEVDHLNGILYTDHLASHQDLYRIDAMPKIDPKIRDHSVTEPGDNDLNSTATIKVK